MLCLFSPALRYLRYYLLRTILVLCATLTAFFTYGVLGTLDYSLASGGSGVSDQRLVVMHRAGLMQTLPLAYAGRIRQLPGVDAVGHATWLGAFYQQPTNMLMVLAVDPDTWLRQHPDMQLTHEARDAFVSQPGSMLVSKLLAEKFGWGVGDIVPLQSILYPSPSGEPAWRFTVAGVYRSSDNGGGRNYIVTHYSFLNENRNYWKDTVGTLMVTATNDVSMMQLAQQIDELFINTDSPTSTNTDKVFHDEFFAQYGNVLGMIRMTVMVAFASLLIMIASSMALSVRRMSMDISVLKVIGYTDMKIFVFVMLQITMPVFSGAAVGMCLAALVNYAVTRTWPQWLPDVIVPLPVLVQGGVIALAVSCLACLLPIMLALRVQPAKAFRMEQE